MEAKIGENIINIDEKTFIQMLKDAKSWNDLHDKIAKCYAEEGDEDFDEHKGEADLVTIGELAASAFGFL